MSRVEEGRPYAWGELYAALLALEGIAAGGRIGAVPEQQVRRTAYMPRSVFEDHLRNVGGQVFTARQKGGTVAEAAATVFADIGRLIRPERMPLHGLGQSAAEEFRRGYAARAATYREAWAELAG
ncbi:hypothetical protein ACFY7C_10045 [Streptomyces sp. NPDC012769]|uniref:hypothetical protein n=1 Tax=Streptomyces sp. NPDC012769 TaxID=3364848 RepID=UPI003694E575